MYIVQGPYLGGVMFITSLIKENLRKFLLTLSFFADDLNSIFTEW